MVKFKKLIQRLEKKKLKVSFAESCTGGLLAQSITSISGASKVFNLSVVTYSNDSKISILNVPRKIIDKFGIINIGGKTRSVYSFGKIYNPGIVKSKCVDKKIPLKQTMNLNKLKKILG